MSVNTKIMAVPQQPPKSHDKPGLILLGRDRARGSGALVSQLRLARIQQMQADIAYMQMELQREWDAVRKDLLSGAAVEKGPLRAWIKCTLRLAQAGGEVAKYRRDVRKRLMVR